MVNISDKVQETGEMSGQNQTPERVSSDTNQKTCADCGTTKTPLWRGGPAGPKSLCNACGIRSRKKRRALLGLNKEDKKSKKSSNKSIVNHHHHQNQSSNSSSSTGSSGESTTSNAVMKNECVPFKKRLLHFDREVGLQRPRSSSTTHRRKLGDEEQAAFLLMALSCGSVYA